MSAAARRVKNLAPIDDNVKIPDAVRVASAKSDQLHAAVYTPPTPPAPEPDPAVVAADTAAASAASAAPPTNPEPPAGTAPASAEPPTGTAPASAEPPPSPTPPTPVLNGSWEQKYLAMKGRNERNEQLARTLSERVSGLEATMATMAAKSAAPTQTPSTVTEAEVAAYGSEFLDVVTRQATEAATRIVAPLQESLKEQTERQHREARIRMQNELTAALPNWLEINQNEKFMDWLALPDTYSGAIRHHLLKAAYAANQTPRVLAFFHGFLSEEAALAPTVVVPDPAVANSAAPKVPLESLAAPGRAKTAATNVPAEKPSFTRAQILKFYADVARGAYRGKDEDKNRLEQQIHAASREGRVTP